MEYRSGKSVKASIWSQRERTGTRSVSIAIEVEHDFVGSIGWNNTEDGAASREAVASTAGYGQSVEVAIRSRHHRLGNVAVSAILGRTELVNDFESRFPAHSVQNALSWPTAIRGHAIEISVGAFYNRTRIVTVGIVVPWAREKRVQKGKLAVGRNRKDGSPIRL